MTKILILINKLVYLGWSILNLSKYVIYEFWYDYMDISRFIVTVGADNIYKDIAEDVETRFSTSHFESDKPLTNEKTKSIIWLMIIR